MERFVLPEAEIQIRVVRKGDFCCKDIEVSHEIEERVESSNSTKCEEELGLRIARTGTWMPPGHLLSLGLTSLSLCPLSSLSNQARLLHVALDKTIGCSQNCRLQAFTTRKTLIPSPAEQF